MCCSSLSIEPVSFSCWGMSIGGEGGRELGQPEAGALQLLPLICAARAVHAFAQRRFDTG